MKNNNLAAKLVAIMACLLATSCQQGTTTENEKNKKPNILLVVADDMAWTDLGCFGSEIKTPKLDALAKRSTMFTDFHTSMSCSPTRSMLLSGTDNHIAGVGNMAEILTPDQKGKPGYEGRLNRRIVSLAEVLRGNGYHTYMAGKWHLGHEPGQLPFDRGFEKSFSLLNGGASFWSDMIGPLAAQPFSTYVKDDQVLKELPGDFYATRSYTDFLIETIRENQDDGKPFLAYLAFTSPHDPLHVPEPWQSMYHGQYDDGYHSLKSKRAAGAKDVGIIPANAPEPEGYSGTAPWKTLSAERRQKEAKGMEVYAGMVSNMDYHYGRIEAFLKDIGELDNTIVIFMSDNGPNPWYSEDYFSVKGSDWYAQFDNSAKNIGNPMSHYAYGIGWADAGAGPLSLFKMTMAEAGIRSPMLISGPGFQENQKFNSFTYVWDIMPTILDFAGIDHPESYQEKPVEPMRGKSLKGVLTGTNDAVYDSDEIVCGDMGGNGKWARQGDYKALWVAPPYGNQKWQLFNLGVDPGETKDLSEEMPEKLEALIAGWDQYAQEVGVVL